MAKSNRVTSNPENSEGSNNTPASTFRDITRNDRMSWFEGRLAYFGGAYLPVLQDNLSDKSKYVRIGLFVFVTAIMACTTMSFALHSIFFKSDQKQLVYLFALVWAIIIFIIDWGLVATMRKPESLNWWSFNTYTSIVFPTILRIIVAGLISFTISKPLEVKLFENRLAPAIAELKSIRLQDKINQLDSIANLSNPLPQIDTDINTLITKRSELPEVVKTYDTQINQNNEQVSEKEKQISTLESTNATLRRQNYGDVCVERDENDICTKFEKQWLSASAKGAYNQNRNRIKILSREVGQLQETIRDLRESRQNAIEDHQKPIIEQLDNKKSERDRASSEQTKQADVNAVNKDSLRNAYNLAYDPNYLMVQIEALEVLAADPVQGGSIFWVKWLVFAIIFVIDLMPIFIKLLSPFGPYERAMADLDSEKNAESRLRRSMIRQEYRSNNGLVQRLARSQRDIIRQALDNWRHQQLEKLENDPETSGMMFHNERSDD
ncbi:MAG: DUF4407 domain-containing protein [Saprospiraceae bacterium]|nr:DUF4407 domain-containing protein [Saprospiraceae bacterium]